jgi:hypothetical protein
VNEFSTPSPFEIFTQRIENEFVQGSGINHDLYHEAVQIVADTEVLPGGDVAYPIHEALNWKLTRFGFQARATQFAALLLNEDRSPWQAKLNKPLSNHEKPDKERKYEAPVGNGSRAFLPPVNRETRRRIAHRYSLKAPPAEVSFWDWVKQHPEIPIIITEGGKKSLSLLTQGYVAISLYGVNGGYVCLPDDSRRLIADIARFCQPGRSFVLAFDQDVKEDTRRKVTFALWRFGGLLTQAGCQVAIAAWQPELGKGIDDLFVGSGSDAVDMAIKMVIDEALPLNLKLLRLVAGMCAVDLAISEALPLQLWQLWQRLERRLTTSSVDRKNPNKLPDIVWVKVKTTDLSTLALADIPDSGLIAIASAKGTGKTKQISALAKESKKALAAGHRIALMRNLSPRLGLDYRGDLDKVNGEFITGAGYTLRVGLCVDSLLSIDPNKFAGCDLILDEVVQVIRHLLTSSTCAKDGKRPALLARLRALIQVARRIIVADADLDNATLHYLKELRGDHAPVFLIRNDYQPDGYPVRFIKAPDRSTVVGNLIADVKQLAPGKVLFVAVDSKRTSKAIARLIADECPEKRIRLINSETSGGECEREFIQTPDVVLERGEIDIVICSPSVATGVSIETQGRITKVYGIFTGTSSTDADMAQALGRVRESVERVVWCAERGSNFSKIGNSTNALALKTQLQQKTCASVSLMRSSLREDSAESFERHNWKNNPHLDLFCRIEAEKNLAMHCLRDALWVRLKYEGNQVTVEEAVSNPAARTLLKQAREELKQIDAEAIVNAEDLTYAQVLQLEQKEGMSVDEQRAIAKFHLLDFYCLDTVTLEDVQWDSEGRRRTQLIELENLLYPNVAIERSVKSLEKQTIWNQGVCVWDISTAATRRHLREVFGLLQRLQAARAGETWTDKDNELLADTIRQNATHCKSVLNFTPSKKDEDGKEKVSATQVVHQLLSQVGIKIAFSWRGTGATKHRVYRLDSDSWQQLATVLQRRSERRERLQQKLSAEGSPPSLIDLEQGGDPKIVRWGSRLGEWLLLSSDGAVAKVRQLSGWANRRIFEAPLHELTSPESPA